METLYYFTTISLIFFALLATFDGIYLHIWRFELFNKEESYFEHKTHTARAMLFPLIVWFLFIDNSPSSFWIGISLVLLDLIVLAVDAWSETDSRKSRGGLPRWEYIIHLFSNGFHFAAIALIITVRLISNIQFNDTLPIEPTQAFEMYNFVAFNLIPGSVFFALLHLILTFSFGRKLWSKNRIRVKCC